MVEASTGDSRGPVEGTDPNQEVLVLAMLKFRLIIRSSQETRLCRAGPQAMTVGSRAQPLG